MDSTIARAHQHATGARKQKEPPGGVDAEPDDHGLGRSRGGLTTKLHLVVEQGQKGIRVPRIGPGRPRIKPDKVRADKA